MRVCIVDECKKKSEVGIKRLFCFRGAEVYLLSLPQKREDKARLRAVKRALKKCRKTELSLFAISSRNAYVSSFYELGIQAVTEKKLFLTRASDLALAFCESVGAPYEFCINGGKAKFVADIACNLLKVSRFVFAKTQDFADAAELVLDETGAPLRVWRNEKCVEIRLQESDVGFFWKDVFASLSDFSAEVSEPFPTSVSENLRLPLMSVLEICGILGKNEIKTICLIK